MNRPVNPPLEPSGNVTAIWRLQGVLVLWLLVAAGCASPRSDADPALAAESRAIKFLQREVPAWSRDNGCFSCHNNGDAARALYAAGRHGYRLAGYILADTTRWVSAPEKWDDNKGDPGFSDQRLADVQFAASLLAAWETGHARDGAALSAAARRLIAQQAEDGSWPIDTANPAGSPATYGAALATVMAWRVLSAADNDAARAAVARAERWLAAAPLNNTPAAAALLLWSPKGGADLVGARHDAAFAYLRVAQTSEGGWGPYASTPAEVFDTAVAVLALARHRARPGAGEMIARGRLFLVAQQLADGSWPATTRPSGGVSYAQRLSTTGWAALALLETR
jgi:hypothetical protein